MFLILKYIYTFTLYLRTSRRGTIFAEMYIYLKKNIKYAICKIKKL